MKQVNREGEAQSRGFEDLKAWQLARQLMIECHKMAEVLPVWERYDLTSQVRRSSKSVMANIAEGYYYSARLAERAASLASFDLRCDK